MTFRKKKSRKYTYWRGCGEIGFLVTDGLRITVVWLMIFQFDSGTSVIYIQ